MSLEDSYPISVNILKNTLGKENYEKIKKYLHVYNGESSSVKPVAKHITMYWIGRAADSMVIRTEGEDDIILSQVGDNAVPTIIFRKLKAVYLRDYMQIVRNGWIQYENDIKSNIRYENGYNFLADCSLAVGIAGEGKGALHGRCMKCPVDVLMGATSAGSLYNLHSRFLGDSAYALTPSFTRRTGNAVDETTYTTLMLTEKVSTGEKATGGLYSETTVEPGTIFVGKIVLPMISPPELVYVLWLLTRVIRTGARTSIQGSLEVVPIGMIGDLFEVGTAYEAAEKLQGKKKLEDARKELLDYIEKEAKYATSTEVVKFTNDNNDNIITNLRKLDLLQKDLVIELWKNAKSYVDSVNKYIRKEGKEENEERSKTKEK